jgi:hypothetical protein
MSVVTQPSTPPVLVPGRAPAPAGPPRRPKTWLRVSVGAGVMLLLLAPIVLFAGAANPPQCSTTPGGVAAITDTGGSPAGGHFAAPLTLQQGQWYTIGATEYGPPGTGDYGSDTDPGQSDLATHPDSFAELSTLDINPANPGGPGFTFQDADALGNLPYGTNLRVRGPDGNQLVLAKRDTGYGQGPGGQGPGSLIYRIDVWNGVSGQLGISKSPVAVELAPSSGAGNTLAQTPAPQTPAPAAPATLNTGAACTVTGGGQIPGTLQLTPGQVAQINLTTGNASAPAAAPAPVKLAIAAANSIDAKPYSTENADGSGAASHAYGPLSSPWPAYDCSASTSYVLYKAGLFGPDAWASGQLESWGAPGPGKWITIYANSAHVFVVIAGRAFDTANFGGPNIPDSPYVYGPRWRSDPTGNLDDGTQYVVRHPTGAWNE